VSVCPSVCLSARFIKNYEQIFMKLLERWGVAQRLDFGGSQDHDPGPAILKNFFVKLVEGGPRKNQVRWRPGFFITFAVA